MRISIILILLTFATKASCNIDLGTIIGLGLPVVEISTQNGEEPSCEMVEHPEGCMGQGITNANKIKGRLRIIDGEETLYDSGDYQEDSGGITIRIRGNSSAWAVKKPYKIKLQKAADLLTRGDNRKYADKEWLLIKDEKVSLNTVIGLKVNELMGMQWTPEYKIVNVVMNGDYRGIYLLIESVKRNSSCRLDISKTGYLFEYDPYWWNEDIYFDTPYTCSANAKTAKFTFKYPSDEDITIEHILYLQRFLATLEASFADGSYTEYLDLDSFVSWLLGQDILGNGDGHGSNMYLTKYDDSPTSKVMMANLWDFDVIMTTAGEWSQSHEVFYFGELWRYGGITFSNAYQEKWNEVKVKLVPELSAFLEQFVASSIGEAFNRSIPYDSERWGKEAVSLETLINEAQDWFANREQWLEQNINASSAIKSIKAEEQPTLIYSIEGRRLKSLSKGINIIRQRDGRTKKIIITSK